MGGAATVGPDGFVVRYWRHLLAAVLCVAALVGASLALWPRPAPAMAVITPTVRLTPSPAPDLLVHVVGAVATPGVYRLPAGARVEQAITAAGGLTDEADPASINLAALLADGQQVVVKAHPASGPAADPAAASAKGGKLNINTASAADLDQLPGIGPTLAQRIVDRRQRLGPFQSVEQLRDEKLVPAATYERIRDLVTVS